MIMPEIGIGIIFVIMIGLLIASLIFLRDAILFIVRTIKGEKAAPFVPAPRSALPAIFDALKLADSSVLYDLGCGDGVVLNFCAKRIPGAKYMGLERDFFPILLARIKYGKKVQILRKDFFTYSLSDATHIFLYLFPEVLNALLPKFERELHPGTRVVSLDFQFSHRTPTEIIKLKESGLGKTLFVYEF